MVKQGGHSVGMDPSRRDPRPGIPTQLQASYRLWLVAVAAGVVEAALVVVDATSGDVGSAAQVAVGVAVRLLAFAGLVDLAARLRRGRNWARVALAVLYGGIGTLSPAIGPVTWLAEGGSLSDAVAAADLGSVLFAASRVVHLGAVIAALTLMFTRPPTPTSTQPHGLPRGTGPSRTGTAAQPDDRRRRPPSHQAEERALPAGRRHGGHPRRAQHPHPRTCRSRCAPPTSWPGPRVPTVTATCC
jgi:hypothetical protein